MIRVLRLFAGILLATIIAVPALAGSPALWRLSDDDSEIWLFGTVHLLPPGLQWRSPAFEAAFAAADTVYVETDVSPEAADGLGPLIKQLGLNANYKTLTSMLGPADSERLASAASHLGIPLASLEPMRPWFASIQLTLIHVARQGYDPRSGVDATIIADAIAAGKRLRYFETARQQLEIFAALSPEAEKVFLMASIDQIETDTDFLDKMVRSWATGDTKTLDTLMKEATGAGLPEINDAVFVKRNRTWAEHIARTMTGSGMALVAVGTGHLSGEQGLVAMLRNKGYTVTRQ